MDKGLGFREELLKREQQNPENAKTFPTDLIMSNCIRDFGMFAKISETGVQPNKDDYIFHFTFGLLKECCMNERVPAIIPRVLLNNLALKLLTHEIEMTIPRHQNWAMETFDKVRSDLVPDFIVKLKINHLITNDVLIEITKKMLTQNRYNDASLMIVRYKFQQHFDINFIMLRLLDLNKLETAKLLISNDATLQVELIKALSTNENCKKASQLIKDFKLNMDDFPEVKERIMKNSMRYFLGRNLYKKSNQ